MNWKKFWFSLVAIGIPLALIAQTIRWYNDPLISQKTTLAGTEIFSLQQTGPNLYRWVLASDMRRYMGGTVTDPIQNVYVTVINATTNYVTYQFVTNQYVSLQYVTNQYVTTNYVNNEYVTNLYANYEYVTNLYVTTNFVNNEYVTNQYVSLSYVTNLYVTTNFNNYEYVTNQYVDLSYITNLYVTTNIVNNQYVTNEYVTYSYITNLSVTYLTNLYSYVSNAYFTNIYVSNAYITNLNVENITNTTIQTKVLNVTSNIYYVNAHATNVPWAGPTNTVDFSKGSVQSYTTSGAISVTNVTGEESDWQNSTLLCLTNSSANSLTNTVTATGWKIGDGDSLIFTNGQVLQLWFQNIGGMKTLATKKYSAQ